jgi:excinuclease ABC subunit A
MQFLADLYITCDVCKGKRYKSEVLDIRYRGKNIDEVLNMTVTEAIAFFQADPRGKRVATRLRVLDDVGLGYLRLGQSATTLSGGEAQRVKLAAHLAAQEREDHTLFIFDEPTTGLHFDDIAKLLRCFDALIASGNSIVTIEHNMDVIKCADYIIDLGPEGGDEGGYVVATGTPDQVSKFSKSYTGKFLRAYLNNGKSS